MRTLTFNRVVFDDPLGTVYEAELQTPPNARRAYAVKVVRHRTPDREHFRARMRDAARLLPLVRHPQLLGVVELVHMPDHDAVLMDHVSGVDLGRLMASGPVPPGVLAHIGAELGTILHHAHTATHPATAQPLHFVHRDIKPDNVVIGDDGTVYLMDYGVARAAFDTRESVTQGLVLGTLHYFAPEILSGNVATSAVDLYGLGLTLWESATATRWGQPQVHPQRFAEKVDDHLEAMKPLYRSIRDALRPLLQWEPSERPTAEQARDQFRALAQRLGGPPLAEWAAEVVVPLGASLRQASKADERVGHSVPVTASIPSPSGSAATPVPLDEPSELLPRGAAQAAFAAARTAPPRRHRVPPAAAPTEPQASPRRSPAPPRPREVWVPVIASYEDGQESDGSWWMLGGFAMLMGILATSCTVLSLVVAILTYVSGR